MVFGGQPQATMIAVLLLGLLLGHSSLADPLDDYVNADPQFVKYEFLPEFDYTGEGAALSPTAGKSWKSRCVNLTSQAWLTEADWGADWGGAGAEWWHYMYITIPSEITSPGWRSIYITHGKNTDAAPEPNGEDIGTTANLAMLTGQIFVTLFQVPNYPIYIKSEEEPQKRLGDDDLLAHTFVHYMDYIRSGGDESSLKEASWVVLMPMVKAAFAAMTAAEEILGDQQPAKWQVAGASKRGWATWLVGAVDAARPAEQRRVQAIAPIVLDGVNFNAFLKHHYSCYGGWSYTMRAFHDVEFLSRIDSDEMAALWTLIDPITFKTRFKGMPKLVMDATGDEWFLLDDSRYWIADMWENGPTSLVMIPDAEHSMATAFPSMVPDLAAFLGNVATASPLPSMTWSIDYEVGAIRVTLDEVGATFARTVQVLTASTCHAEAPRRDFRLANLDLQTFGSCSCGTAIDDRMCSNLEAGLWVNATVGPDLLFDPSGNTYTASVEIPDRKQLRWTAFYITVDFHGVSPQLLSTTTTTATTATWNAKENQQRDGGGDSPGGDCSRHFLERKRCLPQVATGDLQLSTTVAVVPDYEPYTCYGEQCQGELL